MRLNFWRRKRFEETETFDQILDALKIIQGNLITVDKEIDMLKLKWKDAMFKRKVRESGEENEEETTKKEKHQDQFDEVRKMQKDLNAHRIGL